MDWVEWAKANPHPGLEIEKVELDRDNVYITDKHGDVWRVWIILDGVFIPQIELVARG